MSKTETTEKAATKEQVSFDPKKDVILIGTGKSKHFPKGVKASCSGADAAALVNSGKATTTTDK